MERPLTGKLIDDSPKWLKSAYVGCIHGVKAILKATGMLDKLDEKSKESRTFHYWRSLLAIHDLPDMVTLGIPWWTYAAIDFLEAKWKNFQSPIQVFEWGSGASTLWLANRADEIISIEHDPKWYTILQPFLQDHKNITLLLKEPDQLLVDEKYTSHRFKGGNFKQYVTAIEAQNKKFDVIIIDGRARSACLEISFRFLKDNGCIVLDNSQRPEYQQAIAHSKLIVKRFPGRVPCSPFLGETALLFKQENNAH